MKLKAETSDKLRPNLILEQFFTGRVAGWGTTVSRTGAVQNQFNIDAEGEWDEKTKRLALIERYRFDDGHSDSLEWTITRLSKTTYQGVEPKLVGTAQGKQSGNHFHWSYRRDTQQKEARTTRLGFSDQFLLVKPNLLLATASVTKFGFGVATLSVVYEKKS